MRTAFRGHNGGSFKCCHTLVVRPAPCGARIQRQPPSFLTSSWLNSRSDARLASTLISFDDVAPRPRSSSGHTSTPKTVAHPAVKTAINSFQDLEAQSDVNHEPSTDSILLVDQSIYRSNITLWIELLEFRQRIHGDNGARDIFHGMKRRAVAVPTRGVVADTFWTKFLAAAADDKIFREQVWALANEQARATGHWWSRFYVELLAPVLKSEPKRAPDWARRMRVSRPSFTVKGSLRELLEPALSSAESLNVFKLVLLRHVDRDTYGWLIPELCKRDLYKEALSFHHFLVRHGDLPETTTEVEPLAKHIALFSDQETFEIFRSSLAKISRSLAAPLASMAGARASSAHDKSIDEAAINDESKRKTISDETAARAFATRAFSVNFIITGLVSFNFQLLGIEAMRELAVRCKTVSDLVQYFQRLKDEGVVIEDRMYNKLMQRLAFDRNQSMFEAVVESDLHPEVYDDRLLQLRLLEQYMQSRDWRQLHRTLTVLTVLYQKPSEQAWNILLRGLLLKKNWPMILTILDEMIAQQVTITEQTINKSFFMLLHSRFPGKTPIIRSRAREDDHLALLTRMWLKILGAGGRIPFYSWRQVLTYYGMQGRIGELESLSMQLATLYTTHEIPGDARASVLEDLSPDTLLEKEQTLRRIQRFRPRRPSENGLALIFTPAKQRAIVEWGFKTLGQNVPKTSRLSPSLPLQPVHSNALTSADDAVSTPYDHLTQWDRGIRLLQSLQRHGLQIDRSVLRLAVRYRLQVLFDPHYKSSERTNRVARQRNPFSLRAMVRHVNKLVAGNLLGIPMALLQDESSSAQETLARAVLGSQGSRGLRRRRLGDHGQPKTIEAGAVTSTEDHHHCQNENIGEHSP